MLEIATITGDRSNTLHRITASIGFGGNGSSYAANTLVRKMAENTNTFSQSIPRGPTNPRF
jgi:hypothetical protein